MTRPQWAARVVHDTPEGLPDPEDDDASHRMSEAFEEKVDQLVEHHDSDDVEQVAVQGEISSMKSWLATFTAKRLQDRGDAVLILVPQRVNRGDIVTRLRDHDVPYIELPARRDLCSWDEWMEEVGHVDEAVCSNNGCRFYPGDRDMERLAAEALSKYRLREQESVQIGREEAERLAGRLEDPVCPFYLMRALDDFIDPEHAVRVATIDKAFSNGQGERFGDADIVLLDEAHTVAADTERFKESVEIDEVLRAVDEAVSCLDTSAGVRQPTLHALGGLRDAISDWFRDRDGEQLDPTSLLDKNPDLLAGGFDTINDSGDALLEEARRRANSRSWKAASKMTSARRSLGKALEFLTALRRWKEGDRDFVHIEHDAKGESIERTYFRLVDDRRTFDTVGDVYRCWQETGTHQTIEQRWGGLLDLHLSQVWTGRKVSPGGGRPLPKPAPRPLDLLQDLTGAETLVGFSATHNDASDPMRASDELRSTRHDLLVMPLLLRTSGDKKKDYHGKRSVQPHTSWFRTLVEKARDRSDTTLASVPVNGRNEKKWKDMPVQRVAVPEGKDREKVVNGLVPNSRAAVGSKDLEEMNIDAVLCGVQVQSPGETACRAIEFWEMIAADYEDPKEALAESWRLVAQHAVTGTIQAGGRFAPEATNLVFEREELVELAGFEWEQATPDNPGFAGEFVSQFEELHRFWEARTGKIRAKKIVRHLMKHDSKSPTRRQYLDTFQRVYDEADAEDARRAVAAAVEDREVVYSKGRLRLPASDELG